MGMKRLDRSFQKDHNSHMKKAAVSELKASLSEYLAKVKRGEEVIVTDRGHPVAKIVPISVSDGPMDRERLIREGIIEPGRTGKIPADFLKGPKIEDPQGLVLKALLEEREEGP